MADRTDSGNCRVAAGQPDRARDRVPYCPDALLQHRRPRPPGQALLRAAARAPRPRPDPHLHPSREVLRAPRAPPDRQDLRPARTARPAQCGLHRRVPLRIRQHRGRAVGPRERGGGHAQHPGRTGLPGAAHAGRRHPGGDVAGPAGEVRPGRRAGRGAEPLGRGRPQAPGAAARRDRHPGRRHPDRGAAPVARRVRPAPRELPAERHPVRGTRRARLPHPRKLAEGCRHRRQRLQHQGRVAAHGRLLRRRDAGPARPAHRGDRTGVRTRRPGMPVDADPGPAVAGQRPGVRGVLPATRPGTTGPGPSPPRRSSKPRSSSSCAG